MTLHHIDPEPDAPTAGLDDLTAAETSMAERKAQQSIATLGNEVYPQVALLGALGWVLARRRQTSLTYEAYMAGRKVKDITRELGLSDDSEDDEDEEAGKDEPPSPEEG